MLTIEIKKMDKAKEFLLGAFWNSIKKSKDGHDKGGHDKAYTEADIQTVKENQSLKHKANAKYNQGEVFEFSTGNLR